MLACGFSRSSLGNFVRGATRSLFPGARLFLRSGNCLGPVTRSSCLICGVVRMNVVNDMSLNVRLLCSSCWLAYCGCIPVPKSGLGQLCMQLSCLFY